MNQLEKEVNLNKIITQMYEKFGKERLSELEKARYLYIELGKLLRYDLNYYTIYDIKQEDCYFKPVYFDNIQTNSYVCRQINLLYAEMLKRVGIDAEAIPSYHALELDDDMPHLYTFIKLQDGRKIIADLTFDLALVQTGMKTESFGSNYDYDCNTISEIELENIDRKIGYTVPVNEKKGKYMDDFLDLLRQELADEDKMKEYLKIAYSQEKNQYKSEELIKYKFDFISRCFFLKEMGYVEGKRFLKSLYQSFFSDEEKKQIYIRFLMFEKSGYRNIVNTEKITCYCWKKSEGDGCEYYIYEEGNNLRHISKEELTEKLSQKQYECLGKGKIIRTNDVDKLFSDDEEILGI